MTEQDRIDSPMRPPEAEGVFAWDMAFQRFFDVPPQSLPPKSQAEPEGPNVVPIVALRLMDKVHINPLEMGKVWGRIGEMSPDDGFDYIRTAIIRGAQAIDRWDKGISKRVANQNQGISRVASSLDELLGEELTDTGLLDGLLEAFEADSDWSGQDVRSMLRQLRSWSQQLRDDPEFRQERFPVDIRTTQSATEPQRPPARWLAAHLKAHLDEPAHVARTVNAVFQNTELLSEETARKKRVTPARPRAPFA